MFIFFCPISYHVHWLFIQIHGAFGQVEMRPGRQRDSEVFEAIQPGFETWRQYVAM